jgi:hypothetical protein
MVYLNALHSQRFAPDELAAAVRATLGKPLRRTAPLSQLAVVGALACLPAAQRSLPSALLWQSSSGPRGETLALLEEICNGAGEPMPYDFLATQPAIAAAQLKPFLPGLDSATHLPLESPGQAQWSLLLALATGWLAQGRYAQVLCAQLDHDAAGSTAHWLLLGRERLENAACRLQLPDSAAATLPDTPDFPEHLAGWLQSGETPAVQLLSSAASGLAVEFARL